MALNPREKISEAFAHNPNDNTWLDCLRTIAISLVILRHGQRVLLMSPDITLWEAFKINGWAGVDLFFVLSGYLVSSGLQRAFEEKGRVHFLSYATKRIRRIVPAYFFVLALVLVGYFPSFVLVEENLLWRVGYHILFMQDVFPSDINVVFWSLGVEAKYYAVIPFIVVFFVRVKDWRWVLGIIILTIFMSLALRWMIYVSGGVFDYYNFWRMLRSPFYACLEPFALGYLVAVLKYRGILRLSPRNASILFGIMVLALIPLLSSHVFLENIDVWDAVFQPFILALVFSLMVAAACEMKPINTRLEPFFRFGARISYSLYLVHFPLIPLSLGLARTFDLGGVGFWVLYIGISMLHAIFILSYIEMPFMKLKKDPNLSKA